LAVQWLSLSAGRQVKLSRKSGTGRASYQVFPQRREDAVADSLVLPCLPTGREIANFL